MRRFRFSMRMLFVCLLLIGVLLVPLAKRLDEARWQREAIAKLGGRADCVYSQSAAPKWLKKILGNDFFCHVSALRIEGATNDDLAWLKDLRSIRHLTLDDSQITDAGLANVRWLSDLETLEIRQVNPHDFTFRVGEITNYGMQHLVDLRHLRVLALNGVRVGNIGIDRLKHVDLVSLDLCHTLVSDELLKSIIDMKRLKNLHVTNTRVTKAGVATFKESLPTCDIRFDKVSHRLRPPVNRRLDVFRGGPRFLLYDRAQQ
jgi:hypothetical protein